jgi:alkanesulfonate monooxygenase SsuD/methylene tetrahydromethanopterin reductase-like flavin-dependent oxidoreductase (luciferase family)
MLALYSGLSGMDLSREVERTLNGKPASNGINSLIEHLVTEDKSLERLRDIARFGGQVGRACFMVGSPVQVADEMESWMEETGVDGFNLQRAGEPQHLIDVVDLIVPELQNRGVYKTAYQPGSFRQKLFGAGDGIHMSHPAAKAKRA